MLFNTLQFVAFFVIVLSLYRAFSDHRWQNALLLVASYVFYGAWDWRFLSLIAVSTLVDFWAAKQIHRSTRKSVRKLCLVASLTVNLGMLGVFKYCDFGIESLNILLAFLGFDVHVHVLNLLLPIGISFYTFQTISYSVDVYRGARPSIDNLLNFALYVAYFPQLVAGPIERSTRLLPQLEAPREVTRNDLRVGILWILLGYFKKVAIADTLAPMVDYVFTNPSEVSGTVSLVGVLAFAVQIYGDFAGYTLIARGLSRLMGIHLIENFRAPYLAHSPRDFWQRWHISLSTWLREYLYFSLGGSHHGRTRTYVNLMITMLLGGLWHGARWNFVLWGAYQGILLVFTHALNDIRRQNEGKIWIGLRIAFTFLLTLFGWLLFRVADLWQLVDILRNITTRFYLTAEVLPYLKPTLVAFILLMIYHLWQERSGNALVLLETNRWVQIGSFGFLVLSLVMIRSRSVPFVYFQF